VPSSRSASPTSPGSEGEPRLRHPAAALACKLALAPLLIAQAVGTRRRALVLPEAAGPREGRAGGTGEAPIRVLIAGDSSAAGVGVVHQDEAVAGHFVRGLHRHTGQPVAWTLRAKSGLTTRGVHAMLEGEPPAPADVAVVISGVNDVVDQIPVGRALRHRAALAGWLLAGGLARHVVFAPLPPIHRFPLLPEPLRRILGADARRHDRALAEWAADQSAVSHARFDIDLNAQSMASDGFHPGEPVYRACGEALAVHVARRLDLSPGALLRHTAARAAATKPGGDTGEGGR
jgi:lysophospholipase L1-like esterase